VYVCMYVCMYVLIIREVGLLAGRTAFVPKARLPSGHLVSGCASDCPDMRG
jgi:hypothetical protein